MCYSLLIYGVSNEEEFKAVKERYSDENFVVNDPYNSAFPHTISPKIFDDYFNKLTHFPMTPIKK